MSHHLKVLREAGWVTTERRGVWVYYSLRPEAVARFQAIAGQVGGSALTPRRPALPVLQPQA